MTISEAFKYFTDRLARIYEPREASNIARIVFEDAFGIRHMAPAVPFSGVGKLNVIIERLLKKEPVQYVLGEADFYGLKLQVTPDVLIPRPETEELVHWVLQSCQKERPLRILDIGTGSGCIALALSRHLPASHVEAIDISPAALSVARQNAEHLGCQVVFREADIFSVLSQTPPFDIIVSNPPYIPQSQREKMSDQVHSYEPALALFAAENDPLQYYRVIRDLSENGSLAIGGSVFLEINEFFAESTAALFADSAWRIELRRDLQGKWRLLRGKLVGPL